MDELQNLLSDPAAMERIRQMAQQLMGSGAAPAPEPPTPPAGDLGALLRGLGIPGPGPGPRGGHPLAAALGPYLTEGRRARLERALGAAEAVRLSGALLGRGGHGL